MRKLNAMTVGFIAIILTITIDSFVLLTAIDNLTDAVRETKQTQAVMTYNEPEEEEEEEEEEIVPVYYEKEASGAIFYTFGDMSMDKYAFGIMINEVQDIYTYYDYDDNRIECKSLAELQEVVMCHIDQAYHNAKFVIEWN